MNCPVCDQPSMAGLNGFCSEECMKEMNQVCKGPCEACRPTYIKRIRVWRMAEVYQTTIIYALRPSEAAKEASENGNQYDWEQHDGTEWEIVEACSEEEPK